MKKFESWAAGYEQRERQISSMQAELAVRADPSIVEEPVKLVQAIYADKLQRLRAQTHAYSEEGSLHGSVLLHRATVKELFPVSTPRAVEELFGVSLDILKWLVDQRYVLLLIQHPLQYADLEFLHPLLCGRFEPACYEIRDRTIYEHLAAEEYDALVDRGRRNPALAVGAPFPSSLQEPYEAFLESPPLRWAERNAQRYAALAAVMGVDALDEVLSVPRESDVNDRTVRQAQSRMFYLHRRLLHPLTQGLGGMPYSLNLARPAPLAVEFDQISFGDQVERQLTTSLAIELPDTISIDLVERAQASEVPELFEALETAVAEHAAARSGLTRDMSSSVARTISSLREEALQLDRNAARAHGALQIAGIGASLSLADSSPELSTLLSGLAGAAPRRVTDGVLHGFARVFGKRGLTWQFWQMQRAVRDISK